MLALRVINAQNSIEVQANQYPIAKRNKQATKKKKGGRSVAHWSRNRRAYFFQNINLISYESEKLKYKSKMNICKCSNKNLSFTWQI